MATQTQVKANRRNAQHSTGPKTDQGKAIVSQNALQHGLLSWKPVVAGFELEEEWDAHRRRMLVDLRPEGHLETVLAERVSLLLWRLGRVARFEMEAISTGQETAEEEWKRRNNNWNKPTLATLLSEADAIRPRLELLQQIQNASSGQKLDAPLTADAIDAAARALNVRIYDPDADEDDEDAEDNSSRDASLPDFVCDKPLDEVAWTVGRARSVLAAIAQGADQALEELLEELIDPLQAALNEKLEQIEWRQVELDQIRRRLLMPDEKTMERIGRYEAGLERAMLRCLHELQRLQASRKGHGGPLPVALDVNLCSDAAA